jgi:hypothetical protein
MSDNKSQESHYRIGFTAYNTLIQHLYSIEYCLYISDQNRDWIKIAAYDVGNRLNLKVVDIACGETVVHVVMRDSYGEQFSYTLGLDCIRKPSCPSLISLYAMVRKMQIEKESSF